MNKFILIIFSYYCLNIQAQTNQQNFVLNHTIKIGILNNIIFENLAMEKKDSSQTINELQKIMTNIISCNQQKYGYQNIGIVKDTNNQKQTLWLELTLTNTKPNYNKADSLSGITLKMVLVDAYNKDRISQFSQKIDNFPIFAHQKMIKNRLTNLTTCLDNILPICSPKLHNKLIPFDKNNAQNRVLVRGITLIRVNHGIVTKTKSFFDNTDIYEYLYWFTHHTIISIQKKRKDFVYENMKIPKLIQTTCFISISMEKNKDKYKIIYGISGTADNQGKFRAGSIDNPIVKTKPFILVDTKRIEEEKDYTEFIYKTQLIFEEITR